MAGTWCQAAYVIRLLRPRKIRQELAKAYNPAERSKDGQSWVSAILEKKNPFQQNSAYIFFK